MRLYLIRHGQTDWNVAKKIQGSTDIPLNDMGKKQAGCLARGMEYRPVTKVYTSRLKRAYETGCAIAESQKVAVEKIPGLEEVGYGVWEGLTIEEIAEQYPKELEQWYSSPVDVAPPGGESQTEIYERGKKAIDRIMAEAKGDVAIVSHGAMVVFLLEYLLQGSRGEDEEDIIVGNASISTIEYDPENRKFRLVQLNDREHLKELE